MSEIIDKHGITWTYSDNRIYSKSQDLSFACQSFADGLETLRIFGYLGGEDEKDD